jgi:saccharopine dehydrogenase-like NADP-dependent oxidoreductase
MTSKAYYLVLFLNHKHAAMKSILVLGAGRSSSSLIAYLLQEAKVNHWQIVVGDASLETAAAKIGNHPSGRAVAFDIQDEAQALGAMTSADVVISLLPAHFHPAVAEYCLLLKKHLLTASYVSPEMQALHEEASANELLFLNECGLDPGIDHMSALQVIDRIKDEGGVLTTFESFTGGLIAPETDPENPWRYKFTWNPRNVVTAGQSTAKYLHEGRYKYIPYQKLFQRITPVHVPGYGDYEGYANRDSLKYIETYGLRDIRTMLRGTLRNKGFCAAWNVLVQLGCCDDTYPMEGVKEMTHQDFIASFLADDGHGSVEERLIRTAGLESNGPEMQRLRWAGFFSDESIGLDNGTPARILEHVLNKRWQLNPQDKDMIVMSHRFGYTKDGKQKEIQATLIAQGDDAVYTAMAKTVGLPLAIAAKLLLQGKIKSRGVVIPVCKEIYEPVLDELRKCGIVLSERGL